MIIHVLKQIVIPMVRILSISQQNDMFDLRIICAHLGHLLISLFQCRINTGAAAIFNAIYLA